MTYGVHRMHRLLPEHGGEEEAAVEEGGGQSGAPLIRVGLERRQALPEGNGGSVQLAQPGHSSHAPQTTRAVYDMQPACGWVDGVCEGEGEGEGEG